MVASTPNSRPYQANWSSSDWALATRHQVAFIDGSVGRVEKLFHSSQRDHISFFDKHLNIEYSGKEKNEGVFIVRSSKGTEIQRIAFKSEKTLKDIFTKYINGKKNEMFLELQEALEEPEKLAQVINRQSKVMGAQPLAFAGIPYKLLSGSPLKENRRALQSAIELVDILHERAIHAVDQGVKRFQFLGADLKIENSQNGSGHFTWAVEEEGPMTISFQSEIQMKKNLKQLLKGHVETSRHRLTELEAELKKLADIEFKISEISFEILINSTGHFVCNQNNTIEARDLSDKETQLIAETSLPPLIGLDMIRYFGNQLVSHTNESLVEDVDTYYTARKARDQQITLYFRMCKQIEIQKETLENTREWFDRLVYEQQFPISFGELFIDVEMSDSTKGELVISEMGVDQLKRISFKSQQEIPVILYQLVDPLYKQYQRELSEAEAKGVKLVKEAKDFLATKQQTEKYQEAAALLQEADQKIRQHLLRGLALTV